MLTTLLTACGEGGLPDAVDLPEPKGPMGFYSGAFPCDGCPGIMVEIYLHNDGYFFGRQEYLSGSAGTRSSASSMGRWLWFADDELLVLQARGPERRFTMPVPGVLELTTQLGGDHRVFQGDKPAEFPGTLALTGTLERRADTTVFAECVTGLETAVGTGSEYDLYQRQLRRAGNPEGPVYAELDGEYLWADDGKPASLVIRKFGTIRPDRSC